LLAKKLRLAIGELTDVGRKRERNQDNVAHQIPVDDETLQRRGALFIVCDGMGGHAAGEVASQLAIDTIRSTYYGAHHRDIITALAHAVEQANGAIYGHAREHPELTGMGTTCVAAVVAGGRAFVVNVGDSRAYLVRSAKMRQITQDHSWVAEQVRVGLLTEEQAKHHSHRNVITRSIGTQPSVTADLFIETIHDGDRLLLCSDGLHGYVDERAIEREMIAEERPDDAAHRLIAMANANGGPDNITALVVHLLEVPEPAEELVLPSGVTAGQAASAAESSTRPLPIVTAPVAVAGSAPANGRAAASGIAASAGAGAASSKRSTGRRAMWGMLQIAALLVLGIGTWAFFFGPLAGSRSTAQNVSADLTHAQTTIDQSSSQDPIAALAALAHDRQQLLDDLNGTDLTAQQRQQVQDKLTALQAAIQSAMQRYNATALIRPLSSSALISYADSANACTPPLATQSEPLQKVTGLQGVAAPAPKSGSAPNSRFFYVLSNSVVYELITPADGNQAPASGTVRCVQIIPPGFTRTQAIATDGQTLDMLSQRSDNSYAIVSTTADGFNPDGSLHFASPTTFNVPTAQGEQPTHLAAQGGTTYITFEQNSGADAGLWIFSGDPTKGPARTLTLPHTVTSMVVSSGTLYLLLIDGAIGQLDSTPGYKANVVIAPSPLPIDAASYAVATPVPALQATNPTTGTHFGPGAIIAVDPGNPNRLLVGDVAASRLVRFTTGSSGANPTLAAQYVYSAPLHDLSPYAAVSANGKLFFYLWSQDHLVVVPAPDI